jgi:hypothetical protein
VPAAGPTLEASWHTWDQIEGVGPVSRLSATIQHMALRQITAPRPSTSLSRTDVVPSEAAEGLLK